MNRKTTIPVLATVLGTLLLLGSGRAEENTSGFSACLNAASPPVSYAVTPFRMLDTRNFPGPVGGPALSDGDTRTFVLPGTVVCLQVPQP
jgi:hypothetical protein